LLSTVAADEDPVFAGIRAHHLARLRRNDGLLMQSKLEQSLAAEHRTYSWPPDDPDTPEGCADDPRWTACQHQIEEISAAESAAMLSLLTTMPLSLMGLAALIRYVGSPADPGPGWSPSILAEGGERAHEDIAQASERFLGNLAAAIPRLFVAP
jgi:hypothetical protein